VRYNRVDPQDVTRMVGILRTYLNDGIVEFERAWRQLQEDFDLAAQVSRHFEIAWRMATGGSSSSGSAGRKERPTLMQPFRRPDPTHGSKPAGCCPRTLSAGYRPQFVVRVTRRCHRFPFDLVSVFPES
jgi:hypothetical protein